MQTMSSQVFPNIICQLSCDCLLIETKHTEKVIVECV